MSNNNHSADNQKKTPKETKQQKVVRLVCLFLALLMILSCVSVLAYVFGSSWNVAADTGYGYPNNLIAVGLECGITEVTVGFGLSTTNGFVVNEAVIGTDDRSVRRIYSLSEEHVYIVNDANLSKSNGSYKNYDGANAAIGGFHIQLTDRMVDGGGAKVPQPLKIDTELVMRETIAEVEGLISGTSFNAIPCYIDNSYVIRVGDFSSADNANKALEQLQSLKNSFNVKIVQPSSTGVSVVDPNLNKILFEYDCYSQLGLSSASDGYLQTYQSRLYKGTMCYRRDSGGVQVTSLIDFEEYVKCVVPWEISSSWNYNALTSFSIVACTYGLMRRNGRFGSHCVDLYDDASDQVYGGFSRVNEKVEAACNETKGQVVFYGGTLARLYYSSSTGGYVVSNSDVWGSAPIPYLATKATPWENYVDRGNGMWTKEVTPTELLNYLRDVPACANLTSPIASVTINSTAGASGYVKSITFTDTAGNQATVGSTTSKVKSALYDYVKSANFVVGKGSVEFKYNVIKNATVLNGVGPGGIVEQNPGYFNKFFISSYYVRSANGKIATGDSFLSFLTHVGRQSLTSDRVNVLTSERYRYLYEKGVDIDNIYNNVSDIPTTPPVYTGNEAISVELKEITETITASNSENFIFAGKGWGHGVGMSQYGVLDLANCGMSGAGIISTYFNDVTVSKY